LMPCSRAIRGSLCIGIADKGRATKANKKMSRKRYRRDCMNGILVRWWKDLLSGKQKMPLVVLWWSSSMDRYELIRSTVLRVEESSACVDNRVDKAERKRWDSDAKRDQSEVGIQTYDHISQWSDNKSPVYKRIVGRGRDLKWADAPVGGHRITARGARVEVQMKRWALRTRVAADG
jgi:hypothetical protein